MSEKRKNRDGVFFILHLAHWCDMMKTRTMRALLSRTPYRKGNRSASLPGQTLGGVLFETTVSRP